MKMILNQQTVGNIGLHYVCYRLSRFGWNVMPTTRNAKGIDILVYSQDALRTLTIQVKSLSRRSPVPLGNKLDNLFANFVIICRNVIEEAPQCFILTPEEIRRLVHKGEKMVKSASGYNHVNMRPRNSMKIGRELARGFPT